MTLLKQNWTKITIGSLVILNVSLFIQNKDILTFYTTLVGNIDTQTAPLNPTATPDTFDYTHFIKVLLPDGSTGTEPICENYKEIQTFKKPIPIIWTARFDGCLMSCVAGSFTLLPKSVNNTYPRFAGYYYGDSSEVDSLGEKTIPEKFQDKNLVLRISGIWGSIEADHPSSVFGGKCVPIVEIEKIEIVK